MVKDWRGGEDGFHLKCYKETCRCEEVESLLKEQRNSDLGQAIEIIKENGHQQDDDTIWCDIDKVIPLIRSKLSE